MASLKSVSVYRLSVISLFSALIVVGAFVRIPLPPVPITLQTFFVYTAAMLLKPKYSLFAVCLYLFLGLSGLPVFTRGGGIFYVLEPTFGYLIGFIPACLVTGNIVKNISGKNLFSLWLSGLAGVFAVYLFGSVYLYLIMNYYVKNPIGFLSMFSLTFFATFAGDLFKCLIAAFLTLRISRIYRNSVYFKSIENK